MEVNTQMSKEQASWFSEQLKRSEREVAEAEAVAVTTGRDVWTDILPEMWKREKQEGTTRGDAPEQVQR